MPVLGFLAITAVVATVVGIPVANMVARGSFVSCSVAFAAVVVIIGDMLVFLN